MKTIRLIKVVLLVAVLLAVTETAQATKTTLNFNAAVPSTLLDGSGVGTGFTTRLSGTGSAIPSSDTNLALNTGGAGLLHITSPINTDPNGPVGVTTIEFPGIQLAPLGFNSTRDFSVTANFVNVPDNTIMDSFDQIGVYVGTSSQSGTRAMVINFDAFGNNNEFAAVNSVNGIDTSQNGSFNTNPTPTGSVSITITRAAGVWSYTLVGTAGSFIGTTTRNPPQPTFLNSLNDLTVGVFSASTNATVFSADLDSFVVNVPVPGDANNDGLVNLDDFIAISDHLFMTEPAGTLGDANLDGVVNYADFRVWKNNYVPGSGAGGGLGGSIPEPCSGVLAVIAVLGVFAGRRFVKRTHNA